MTTGFHLPFAVRSTIHYETGLDHILLLLSTPVDDVTSLFTFVVWRNDDFTVPADEVLRFDQAIGAEDQLMLERVPGSCRSTPPAWSASRPTKPRSSGGASWSACWPGAASRMASPSRRPPRPA